MSAESLPRARIIRRRSVFDAARARGRRLNNRWMTLQILPRDPAQPDGTVVAFLTPKRLGPATVRSKLRRRMREIFRRHLQAGDETHYLIWIARPPAVDSPFEDLKAGMAELRRRVS